MRCFCEDYAPEKMDLFEMIYASRFLRLWQSWSKQNEPREWEIQDQRFPEWEENITKW
jgi:hypothetical protein